MNVDYNVIVKEFTKTSPEEVCNEKINVNCCYDCGKFYVL